jgi:hypothetical protein
MRIRKIQISLLLSILLLLTPALTKVGKRDVIKDGTVRKGATLTLDFNKYFDFSAVEDLSKLSFSVT